MKKLFLAVACALAVSPAYAAKFKIESRMKSQAAQKLLVVGTHLKKQNETFGDATGAVGYSFTRSESEKDINTIKQLNVAKLGLWPEDNDRLKNLTAKPVNEIVEYLLNAISNAEDDSNEAAFKNARAELTEALKAVKADRNLQIFGADHADEDGSWQVLDILDVRSSQVLTIRIGYVGT